MAHLTSNKAGHRGNALLIGPYVGSVVKVMPQPGSCTTLQKEKVNLARTQQTKICKKAGFENANHTHLRKKEKAEIIIIQLFFSP
jgi:hypothetical protein